MALARVRYWFCRYSIGEDTIGDNRRVYTDEEFALILRKAAELAQPTASSGHSSSGLTLDDMKAAAGQVGIDPALVERAARLVTAYATSRPSVLERLLGGRARYRGEAQFPIVLDEADVARLLSAIRIGVGQPGEAHASALGLTWRSSDDGGAVLSLSAQIEDGGTSVNAELDRRGSLAVVVGASGVAGVLTFLFGAAMLGEVAPGYELVGAGVGIAGVLAIARSYWTSSTRTARDRLSHVMDTVSRFLAQPTDTSADSPRELQAMNESDPAEDAS